MAKAMKVSKVPLIVDTDTAGDDTVALLFALKSPMIDLKAVTICAGNIGFDQEVENALYTVEVAGRSGEIPVYPGCRSPLLRSWKTVGHIHGEDGMGNSHFPKAKQRPEPQHAVQAIVNLANRYAGQLVIAGIAPLTNLAVACQLDPDLPKKVKQVYLMAGANQGLGNVTPAAEFNVWVDPDAAKIVFEAGFNLTMVGWEICVRHSVLDDAAWDEIARWETDLSEFFLRVNRVAHQFSKREQRLAGGTHPDALTIAGIIEPSVFTSVKDRYLTVENRSELTRGMTVVDELGVLHREANTHVVYEADGAKFKALLYELLQERW